MWAREFGTDSILKLLLPICAVGLRHLLLLTSVHDVPRARAHLNIMTDYDTFGAWTNSTCSIKDCDVFYATLDTPFNDAATLTLPAPPGNHISLLQAAFLFSGHGNVAPMAS